MEPDAPRTYNLTNKQKHFLRTIIRNHYRGRTDFPPLIVEGLIEERKHVRTQPADGPPPGDPERGDV